MTHEEPVTPRFARARLAGPQAGDMTGRLLNVKIELSSSCAPFVFGASW
jgi:hypothetical protein